MENKKIQRQYAQAAESSTFCLNGSVIAIS